MAYKISINKEECIGCGACAAVCDNFEVDGDVAVVKEEKVTNLGCNKDAADACPKSCITIEKV